MKKHINTLIIIILCFIFSINKSWGKSTQFDHFDTRNGLSQNNINCLSVDSSGYVWIGTLEGISRFNGTVFDIFRSVPSQSNTLAGNFILKLSPCPNGNIWVKIRNRGLNLYNASQNNFKVFTDSCFYPAKAVSLISLVSASDTLLWFTDPNGLYTYNLTNNKTTRIETFQNERNHLIYAGNNDVLLWGNNGISTYSLLEKEKAPKKIMNSAVRTMSQVYNDSLVVINTGKVEVFNIKNHKRTQLLPNEKLNSYLRNSSIYAFAGYNNEIWFGLTTGLVRIIVDGNKIEQVTKFSYNPFDKYSFHGQDAQNFAFDKSGNLWIGTTKYGVNFYSRRRNQFSHHSISVLLKKDKDIDPIRAIFKTANNNLWIGFDRIGLVCIHPDNTQTFFSDIYFPEGKKTLENVRSIYEDSKGNLWISSNKGLCQYNAAKNRIESTLIKYGWEYAWKGTDICYRMSEFTPGQLFVTSKSGIATIDLNNGTLSEIKMPENYIPETVRCIKKDKNSNFWLIGNDQGLCKFCPENHKLRYFPCDKYNFTDNKLYSLEIVGDTMWIGSNNGLMAFDLNKEKVVASFFETNGLSNNIVYCTIYANNHLWMSTNHGISKLNLSDLSIEKYLTDDVFMDDAFFTDNKGVIYFGGYDGFVSFSPKKIQDKSIPPHPIISDLYLNNHKVTVGEKIKGRQVLTNTIRNSETLQLAYSTSSFSLDFDAFPFNYPDQTVFRYRLKGQSDDWVNVPLKSSRATFSNLSPGKYIFEVEASTVSRVWSKPKQLQIVIIPPFYQTTWFKSLCIAFIIFIALLIFQIRLYRIKKWNQQLERKIKEQTSSIEQQKNKIIAQKEKVVLLKQRLHEADQAKLKYYTNLSHEFRTPLTIIQGNIDLLRERTHGINQTVLRNIKRSSDRLYRLVNQFIDLRKYDQGELKLQISNFDIVAFTKEIADTFNVAAQRKNIHIEFLKKNKTIFLWLDKDKTDKIIYNILTNAIKYTNNDGTVFIDFEEQENEAVLRIKDTGIGISEEDQKNIYKRFFRGERIAPYTDGHGMGLTLVNALMKIQKGKITCSSKLGVGTSFNLIFKKGKTHFQPSDFAKEDSYNIPQPMEKPTITTIDSGNPSGNNILLVEDNPELLEYMSSLLGKYYKIQTATNGEAALLKIKDNTPELIITDMMMPLMNGIELTKKVREMRETRFIPVIMLSAKTDISSKIEGLQTDIDAYVEKPFNTNLLLSLINNLLNKYSNIKKYTEQFVKKNNTTLNNAEKEFLKNVFIIIEKNYSDPDFNTDILSNLLGMSRVTFYRRIKKIEQINPGLVIRKFRLKKAATLIKEGSKTITEICNDVGFQSLSNFRKSFKEEYGYTPSKYKEINE